MKKLIIISLFCFVVFNAVSQDTTKMDISQIPYEVGTLYEKAYIDIGEINRVGEVQILEVKDLIEDMVKKYIWVEYKTLSRGYYSTYSVALTKEEAKSLITAMEKIVSIVNGEKKFNDTELVFKTYKGLIVGALYDKVDFKWTFFLQKDQTISNSFGSIKKEQFISFLNYIKSAYKSI